MMTLTFHHSLPLRTLLCTPYYNTAHGALKSRGAPKAACTRRQPRRATSAVQSPANLCCICHFMFPVISLPSVTKGHAKISLHILSAVSEYHLWTSNVKAGESCKQLRHWASCINTRFYAIKHYSLDVCEADLRAVFRRSHHLVCF